MSKDKNSAEKVAQATKDKAPSVDIPTQKNNQQKKGNQKDSPVNVIQLGELEKLNQGRMVTGLDPNHQVDLLNGLDRHFMGPNAAEKLKLSQETVDKVNAITAIGYVTVLVDEVLYAQNPFATRMRMAQLEAIKEIAPMVGVSIDTKLLPAPDAEGFVEVPSDAIKISKETQKAAKEEHKIKDQTPEMDPTKITNDEMLKEAILHILVQNDRPYDRISKAIAFYQSTKEFQASKSENKEFELAELKKLSRASVLDKISKLVGRCPFSVNGLAHYLYTTTATTKSPISAFCSLRSASLNKKTGMPTIDDSLVADIVKVLVTWSANSGIADNQDSIKVSKKNIDVLSANAKANAKAIASENEKIDQHNKNIEHFNKVIEYVSNPTNDVPDNLLSWYADNNSTEWKNAHRIFGNICDTYYNGIDLKKKNPVGVKHNVQQYAGIITNMFRDPMEQLKNYSEGNITELVDVEAPKTEEKPAEEEKQKPAETKKEQKKEKK